MSINQGLGNAQALCGSHLCPVGFYFAPCITVAKPGIAPQTLSMEDIMELTNIGFNYNTNWLGLPHCQDFLYQSNKIRQFFTAFFFLCMRERKNS